MSWPKFWSLDSIFRIRSGYRELPPSQNSNQLNSPMKADAIDEVEPIASEAELGASTATDSTINWRATTWLTTFYLLTTDVLGPSSAPWSTSKFGFVPGTVLFVSMGLLAGYSSVLLWKIFLRLDSPQTPIRTWRDIGDRLCGPWLGNLITFMQSTQMFLGVAIVLLGNAQSLSQIIKFKLCFVVILLLLTLLGAVIGCIRTFRRLSLLAMFSVYGIAAVCIITMVADSRSYPYFGDGTPVKIEAIRHGVDFQTQLIAAMNMVNAYGGQSNSLSEPYFPGGLTFALRPVATDIQFFQALFFL